MGSQRSIAEIKVIESGQSPLNAMAPALESDLQSSSMNNKLDCGRVLRDYKCNYDAYLDANPSVKAWADANPELAAKEKTRLGAFTQEEIEQKAKLKENSLQRMQPALGAMKGFAPKPECNVKLHDYECSYDRYLEANPSMKTWAELNPEMANNERLKLQSVDSIINCRDAESSSDAALAHKQQQHLFLLQMDYLQVQLVKFCIQGWGQLCSMIANVL